MERERRSRLWESLCAVTAMGNAALARGAVARMLGRLCDAVEAMDRHAGVRRKNEPRPPRLPRGVRESLVLRTIGRIARARWADPAPMLILLGAALPFFNLLPHPTLCLLLWVGITDGAWLLRRLTVGRGWRPALLDRLVLLFALLQAAGGLLGGGGRAGALAGLSAALLVSAWLPTVDLMRDEVRRERLARACIVSASLVATLGVGEYFLTEMTPQWVDVSRFGDIGGRVCATFSNPNLLAVYLLLILPQALARALRGADRREVVGYGAAASVMGLCLLLTWSRGAWLGALVATALILLLGGCRTQAGLLISLPALLTVALSLPSSVRRRFGSITSLSESSIRYRLYTWRGVRTMLQSYPWGIGTGEGAFRRFYPAFAVSGTEGVMHAHRLLLQVAVELGLPGAILLICILALLLLLACRGLLQLRGSARTALLGSTAGLVAALVAGLFDHVWYHYGNLLLFWVVAATLTLPVRETREENG